jgi:hypothetical protein
MLWIRRMLGVGLMIFSGPAFAGVASAPACDVRVAPCNAPPALANHNNATAQKQVAHPLPAVVARSGTGRRHLAFRSSRTQIVARRSPDKKSPPVLARGAERAPPHPREARSGLQREHGAFATAVGIAKRSEHEGWVEAMTLPLTHLTAERDANVRSEALESSYGTFDLVAEWQRSVSELAMVNVWPEWMLTTFDEFPPITPVHPNPPQLNESHVHH